jgi:hypothetical protein
MADYSTLLKTFGSSGSEYPDGYSYIEGEQPVDAWDNFLNYNYIEDIQHLISLTNKRIESGSGSSFPSNPDTTHSFYRSDDERLYTFNSTQDEWEGILKVDGDQLEGPLNANGHSISNIGGFNLQNSGDLSGNDLKDSEAGNLIYNSSAGEVPISTLSEDSITVNTGSHLSAGGTISLGGSISIDLNDDFLLNDGDTMTGELRGRRQEGSRLFTAENTTSGNKLSVKSETDGDFLLVGYDNASASWEYGSALEYSPGSGVWTFNSTPTIDGDSVATKNWVSDEADVSNADHADNADRVNGNEIKVSTQTANISDGSQEQLDVQGVAPDINTIISVNVSAYDSDTLNEEFRIVESDDLSISDVAWNHAFQPDGDSIPAVTRATVSNNTNTGDITAELVVQYI